MRIFLSYSRRDDKISTAVARRLESVGHEVWRDVSSIPGGSAWRASIEEGIRSAGVFVLLLSPNVAENPRYPREELDFARSIERHIIPVYVKALTKLPDGYGLTLGGLEHVNLFPSFEAGMRTLLGVIGEPLIQSAELPAVAKRRLSQLGLDRAHGAVRRIGVEVKQRELGPKVVKVGATLLAIYGTAKISAGKERAAEAERSNDRLLAAKALEKDSYHGRATKLLLDFQREYSRSQEDAYSWEVYEQDYRHHFWHFLGQLESLEAPTPEMKDVHSAFVKNLRDSLTSLDEAYHHAAQGRSQRAVISLQRSYEKLLETIVSFLAPLSDSRE